MHSRHTVAERPGAGGAAVVAGGVEHAGEVDERLPLVERARAEEAREPRAAADRGAELVALTQVREADPLELDATPPGALHRPEHGRPRRLHREQVPDRRGPAAG